MVYAGFWRRFLAYLLDVLPIVLIVAGVFYLFLGFDVTLQTYWEDRTLENRVRFLVERNRIRDLSFLLWVFYSMVLEASPLEGTIGKLICGIKVVDEAGRRLGPGQSVRRNFAKLASYVPLGLGFLWAAFSKTKRAWHDTAAKTYVIRRD